MKRIFFSAIFLASLTPFSSSAVSVTTDNTWPFWLNADPTTSMFSFAGMLVLPGGMVLQSMPNDFSPGATTDPGFAGAVFGSMMANDNVVISETEPGKYSATKIGYGVLAASVSVSFGPAVAYVYAGGAAGFCKVWVIIRNGLNFAQAQNYANSGIIQGAALTRVPMNQQELAYDIKASKIGYGDVLSMSRYLFGSGFVGASAGVIISAGGSVSGAGSVFWTEQIVPIRPDVVDVSYTSGLTGTRSGSLTFTGAALSAAVTGIRQSTNNMEFNLNTPFGEMMYQLFVAGDIQTAVELATTPVGMLNDLFGAKFATQLGSATANKLTTALAYRVGYANAIKIVHQYYKWISQNANRSYPALRAYPALQAYWQKKFPYGTQPSANYLPAANYFKNGNVKWVAERKNKAKQTTYSSNWTLPNLPFIFKSFDLKSTRAESEKSKKYADPAAFVIQKSYLANVQHLTQGKASDNTSRTEAFSANGAYTYLLTDKTVNKSLDKLSKKRLDSTADGVQHPQYAATMKYNFQTKNFGSWRTGRWTNELFKVVNYLGYYPEFEEDKLTAEKPAKTTRGATWDFLDDTEAINQGSVDFNAEVLIPPVAVNRLLSGGINQQAFDKKCNEYALVSFQDYERVLNLDKKRPGDSNALAQQAEAALKAARRAKSPDSTIQALTATWKAAVKNVLKEDLKEVQLINMEEQCMGSRGFLYKAWSKAVALKQKVKFTPMTLSEQDTCKKQFEKKVIPDMCTNLSKQLAVTQAAYTAATVNDKKNGRAVVTPILKGFGDFGALALQSPYTARALIKILDDVAVGTRYDHALTVAFSWRKVANKSFETQSFSFVAFKPSGCNVKFLAGKANGIDETCGGTPADQAAEAAKLSSADGTAAGIVPAIPAQPDSAAAAGDTDPRRLP